MDRVLDCMPGRARANRHGRALGVELDAAHPAHVEHDPAAAEGLSSHAMAHACGRNWKARSAGIRQRIRDFPFTARSNDADNARSAEAARVIDRPALLHPVWLRDLRGYGARNF